MGTWWEQAKNHKMVRLRFFNPQFQSTSKTYLGALSSNFSSALKVIIEEVWVVYFMVFGLVPTSTHTTTTFPVF